MCGRGEGRTVKGNRNTALEKEEECCGKQGVIYDYDLHWSLLPMTPVWW